MDATPINLPDHAFFSPMSTDSPRIPHRASTGYKRDSVNRAFMLLVPQLKYSHTDTLKPSDLDRRSWLSIVINHMV